MVLDSAKYSTKSSPYSYTVKGGILCQFIFLMRNLTLLEYFTQDIVAYVTPANKGNFDFNSLQKHKILIELLLIRASTHLHPMAIFVTPNYYCY